MFLHNFKYALKTLIKNKSTIFWTLIFPIGLTTFMYMAFGSLFEADELFSRIPVAVVSDGKLDNSLLYVISVLSMEGENQLLDADVMTEEEALESLENEDVLGVIYTADASLIVKSSSTKAAIIETILRQYKQSDYIISDIAANNPEAADVALEKLTSDITYYVESTTSDGCQNEYYNYFYAIFAMSCLFASFVAISRIESLQANTSPLGMRRCLSPNNKLVTVISEYLALLIVQFVIEIIALIYMTILGIDLGHKYPAIILTLLLGCNIGIAMGIIIGACSKLSAGAKNGIAVAISMLLSVMADLCIGGVKDLIEHKAPIINRLNPAALISDCFYTLNVYDNYSRFLSDILILGIMTIVLLTASIAILRKNRYTSV